MSQLALTAAMNADRETAEEVNSELVFLYALQVLPSHEVPVVAAQISACALRPFLDSIGVAGPQRDDAVRDAIQEGEATVANVHLTQEFVDQHGL